MACDSYSIHWFFFQWCVCTPLDRPFYSVPERRSGVSFACIHMHSGGVQSRGMCGQLDGEMSSACIASPYFSTAIFS